eukprot:Lankesteria_metandrocarpae@DN6113_c0_g1_i1.p1
MSSSPTTSTTIPTAATSATTTTTRPTVVTTDVTDRLTLQIDAIARQVQQLVHNSSSRRRSRSRSSNGSSTTSSRRRRQQQQQRAATLPPAVPRATMLNVADVSPTFDAMHAAVRLTPGDDTNSVQFETTANVKHITLEQRSPLETILRGSEPHGKVLALRRYFITRLRQAYATKLITDDERCQLLIAVGSVRQAWHLTMLDTAITEANAEDIRAWLRQNTFTNFGNIINISSNSGNNNNSSNSSRSSSSGNSNYRKPYQQNNNYNNSSSSGPQGPRVK